MSKIAYLECPTGIAGDMCLGAIVSAGISLDYLIDRLAGLGLAGEFQLRSQLVDRGGQEATKVHVDLTHSETEPPTFDRHHHHNHNLRHLGAIEKIIKNAQLPPRAEQWSLAVFRRLAEAEGAVHGISPEKVHFHEVGATDAIVDIVGTCLGFDALGIDRLYCSPLPTGGGTVKAAHGTLTVPVPAVLKLWESRQVPVYSNGIDRELVTPTGAAIVTTLASDFGSPPTMQLQKVGLGAGTRDLPISNILRLWLGEGTEAIANTEAVALLETQIDDATPQAIGHVFESLLAAGALDVFTQAVGMKKCRPGVLLSVICAPETVPVCEAILFRETTTLGIRKSIQTRSLLKRNLEAIETPYGIVQVKVATYNDGAIANVKPEYEDCARAAREHSIAWQEVSSMALQIWYNNRQVSPS